MKRPLCFVFAILCFGTMVGCSLPHTERLRPLELTVIDAETSEPVQDIPVLYKMTVAYYDTWIGIIPNIDPSAVHRTIALEEKYTDEHGEVRFDSRNVKLKKDEIFDYEVIYVNVDADIEKFFRDRPYRKVIPENKADEIELRMGIIGNLQLHKEEPEYVFNPNPKYQGVYILSSKRPYPGYYSGSYTYRVIDNSGGLKKKNQKMEIKLYHN